MWLIRKLKGVECAVTTVAHSYHMFLFGCDDERRMIKYVYFSVGFGIEKISKGINVCV